MMRGLRPLIGLVAAAWAASASAQEMEEVPTPPEYQQQQQQLCCADVALLREPPRDPTNVLFNVSLGPTYRRAFKEDFAAAALELGIGATGASFGMEAELSLAFGATRIGLPYQFVTIGPAMVFRVSDRVRLGFGITFGGMFIQRASIAKQSDPTIMAVTAGAHGDVRVDLLRTQRGGALYATARLGWDIIDNTSSDFFSTGSSLALTAALGYRY